MLLFHFSVSCQGNLNKAGYTAVRCVPLGMSLLASFLVTPSHHPPLTIPYPYPIAEVENTRFRVLEKKTGYEHTDGPTDPHIEMRGRI